MSDGESARVGESAPDFALKDQRNEELQLSSLRGKRVLLSFHPLAWTKICAEQMQSLEENRPTFESLNTVPLGLSVDSVPCKRAWADSLAIEKTRLLSDFWPHGHVAGLFGLLREKDGISERANVIVDEEGKIAFLKKYPIAELPNINEITDFLGMQEQE